MEYAILGIHDENVRTIPGNVARVRLFVHPEAENKEDRFVDEDFDLPQIMPGTEPTLAVYETLLRDKILARLSELKAGTTNE